VRVQTRAHSSQQKRRQHEPCIPSVDQTASYPQEVLWSIEAGLSSCGGMRGREERERLTNERMTRDLIRQFMFQQSQTSLNKPNIIDHVTCVPRTQLELHVQLSYNLCLFVVVVVILFPGLAATSVAVLL
jgi:hypothetical protein